MTADSPNPVSVTSDSIDSRPARPRSVILLALGVLSIAAFGLLRGFMAIKQWQFLASWPGVSPAYLAISGLAVGLLSVLVCWALWWRKIFALRLTWAAVWTIALAYWLDQLFIADHPFKDTGELSLTFLPANWPFAAGMTVIFLVYTAWVVHRANVKAYYGETNE